MQKKACIRIIFLICIILLITKTDLSIQGAKAGIEICLYSIIPSLFPFFFLSGCLSNTFTQNNTPHASRLLTSLGIPQGAGSLCLLCAFCGYPVGAKVISEHYSNGTIEKDTAHRLLGFVNLTGPAFIFGIAAKLFSKIYTALIIWLIQIVSAVIVALILPGTEQNTCHTSKRRALTATQILENSIKNISLVCSWVIIFKILLQYVNHYFSAILPQSLFTVLSGILEITNGCISLNLITTEAWRFILCNLFLSFGGICVWMQIFSVTQILGSGMFVYGKILQTSVCGILTIIAQAFMYPGAISTPAVIMFYLVCIIVISTFCYIINRKNSRKDNLTVV